MKKYAVYVGAGLALVVALIAFGRACRIGDKYSRLEGQYQEALRIAKVDAEILNKTIAEKEKVIAEKDKAIVASTAQVGHLTDAIDHKDSDLAELDAKLAAAKTDAERVPILRAEVAAWSEKFNLAEQTIAEKDKQITAWAAKFDAKVVISESWKQKYENEVRLHEISRTEISALKVRLISTRLVGTLKSGLIVAAVGYIGYSALKGK
jgi:chromosome segregation ATPase